MASNDGLPLSKKPFGLSIPSKSKSTSTLSKSCLAAAAFSVDDDDAEMNKSSSLHDNKAPATKRLMLNPKDQRAIEQALEQDPNIYDYDGVYEEVSSTVQQDKRREEKKRLERESNAPRQPKYMAGLLEKGKEREKEHDRFLERRIERERKEEGDLYKDKETFVTPAYKLKLAERQVDLEREKFEEKREAMLNVLQQDNMDAFYRYQYKVRTGDITILEESEKVKTEPHQPVSIKKEAPVSLSERGRAARQLRARSTAESAVADVDEHEKTTDDDQDNMYARAREKHARAVEREHRMDVDDNEATAPVPPPAPPVQRSAAVKVRRINDETSATFDDEEIDMSGGLGGKKDKAKKKRTDGKTDSKENQSSSAVGDKRQQIEETRADRLRRLCKKRTVGEALDQAKQAYVERQQIRERLKDYIERAD